MSLKSLLYLGVKSFHLKSEKNFQNLEFHVTMIVGKVVKGSVAQWLEQGTHKPKVVGSNPTRAIYFQVKLI